MLKSLFTEHPASVGETYTQHLAMASWFSRRMLLACVACQIHAVLPFLFKKTGSTIIDQLHDRMVVNRHRAGAKSPKPLTALRPAAE